MGYLGGMGETGFDMEQVMAWAEVLDAADPDPYRVSVRRQIYSRQHDMQALVDLARSGEFERARPRTLSWLGFCFQRVGEPEAMDDVYRRALDIHPTDFMLNFDYAWSLAHLGRWEEAMRYYHRALALRPNNSGVWRSLGVALWETGDLDGAIACLGAEGVARIREKLARRLDGEGRLHVVSSESRLQARNLEAALARMEKLIRGALAQPRPRKPTRPTSGSRERRLAGKRQQSEKKRLRGRDPSED